MAWTQTDIDALKAAIAQGAVLQSMTFADQTYTFRSLREMRDLLAAMQAEVNGRSSGHRYAVTNKGC
jgi:hypothetical protein